MNIFASLAESSTFCFSVDDYLVGFKKIVEYNGEWGFTIPDEVLAIMSAHSPGIIRYGIADSGFSYDEGTIIGYDFSVIYQSIGKN